MVLQSNNWCFTHNNYCDNDVASLMNLGSSDAVSYLVFGKEVGESGTPHLQGFIRFNSHKRLGGVKTLLGDDVHIEVAKNPAV